MVSGDSLLDWTADGCLLPAEIIRSFVLPLLGAQDENFLRCSVHFVIVSVQAVWTWHLGQDLLQRVQVLNSVHAEEARAQVLSGTSRSQVS